MNIYPCPTCDGFTERFRKSCHRCVAAFSAEWEPIDPHQPTAPRLSRWERFKAWAEDRWPELGDLLWTDDDEETA